MTKLAPEWVRTSDPVIRSPACYRWTTAPRRHFQNNCLEAYICQPRWLSGLRRSRVHSLVIARRSLCPEKLGSNPGQGSKGINFSGCHGLDMSITVTKRR